MNEAVPTWAWMSLTAVNAVLLALSHWLYIRRDARISEAIAMFRAESTRHDKEAANSKYDDERILLLATANTYAKCALTLNHIFRSWPKPPWMV